MTRLLCHLAVTVALHSTAFSQQPSATLSLDEELTEAPAFDPRAVVDEWQITIEPSIAFMAFAGDLTMPGAGSVEIELDDLNLDSPTLAPSEPSELREESGPSPPERSTSRRKATRPPPAPDRSGPRPSRGAIGCHPRSASAAQIFAPDTTL